MLNQALQLTPAFQQETFEWFTGKRHGMAKWQYMEPLFEGDRVQGANLWAMWANTAAQNPNNMLNRQGDLIAERVADMVTLSGERHTLADLGTGGLNAVIRNTVPFVKAYGPSLRIFNAVDLAEHSAIDAAQKIKAVNGALDSNAINEDFFAKGLNFPHVGDTAALLMGGTIGNIEAEQNTPNAIQLMAGRIEQLRHTLPPGTVIFIGLEATQSRELLMADYDDPAHAEYEINVMHAIKRDLLQDQNGFNPDAWKYSMAWWPDAFQFCHLVEATTDQKFVMMSEQIEFSKGDQLIVDNSFKFTVPAMQRSAQLARAEYLHAFADHDGRMVIHALKL